MPSDPVSDENPYAPPLSGVDEDTGQLWIRARIDRRCLVVPRDWRSPRMCLLSGDVENLRPAKSIGWVAVVPVIGLLVIAVITAARSVIVPLFVLAAAGVCCLLPQGPNLFRLFGTTDIHWFLSRRMARRRKWQRRLRIMIIAAVVILPKILVPGSNFYLVSMFFFPLAGLTRMLAPEFITVRITGDSVSFLGIPEEVMEKIVQLDLGRPPALQHASLSVANAGGRTV